MGVDLESSVKERGRFVTQIIHFVGGIKRTVEGVRTETIRQGQFTKFYLRDGSSVMVNDTNVLMIEIFPEKDEEENEEKRAELLKSISNKEL